MATSYTLGVPKPLLRHALKCPLPGMATMQCIQFPARKLMSSQNGDLNSGHIQSGPNEGIFFLDGIYPLRLRWLFRFPLLNADNKIPDVLKQLQKPDEESNDPRTIMERALPSDLPIQVSKIIPRVMEGGSFVKFSHPPQVESRAIEDTLRKFLKENPVRPIFNPFSRVRARLVEGKPWVEDLARFPSTRLKIEFVPTTPGGEAVELSQETLYSLFRKYGKIADITSQPADSKVLPKYAFLNFRFTKKAIMARNCLHGFILPEADGGGKGGTVLKLSYEQIIKAHYIREWLSSHPRIVLPILLALLGTLLVAIFDPIRTFFIKAHVSRSFNIMENPIYEWFRSQLSQANALIKFHRGNEELSAGIIWEDRREDIEQIQAWLLETSGTFIIIQGPRGSGKKEFVLDQALKDRRNNLVIDCKPIQEARNDSAIISAAANEVGYRPVFSWMNSISSLIDLAAQGTIGTKTGFSETLDAQLAKIWQNTGEALKQLALANRRKTDKDAELSGDVWLEAHPEHRPVVVIDNFLHKSNESSVVYDKIAEWAATITTSNVAHVVFLTNDVSFSKSLGAALPGRVFRQIALGDFSPDLAKRFVTNYLAANVEGDVVETGSHGSKTTPSTRRADLRELDGSIEILGGRLTDLEFLARRIKAGETPNRAVQDIIEQSASEILKMYLLDADKSLRAWTPEQAWHLIGALARTNQLRYSEVLLSDIYKTGGEASIKALEQAELVAVVSSNGRPYSIKPGKPVYQAAFRYLTEDHVLKARFDLATLAELSKLESSSIDKYEIELQLLSRLSKQPRELAARIQWLLNKVQASQEKIEKYERDSGVLKKILLKEY